MESLIKEPIKATLIFTNTLGVVVFRHVHLHNCTAVTDNMYKWKNFLKLTYKIKKRREIKIYRFETIAIGKGWQKISANDSYTSFNVDDYEKIKKQLTDVLAEINDNKIILNNLEK